MRRTVRVELLEDLRERDAGALGLQLLEEEGDGLERLRDRLHVLFVVRVRDSAVVKCGGTPYAYGRADDHTYRERAR